MKKSNKIIQKIKNNIPGFITGILMCSLVGVAAATVFPSNSVTYDNKESGLNANNVQTAIDELYNTCFPPGPLDGTVFEDKVVTSGDGLYKDEYEDRYFYRGANPNNYITFNNEKAGWRIVSVETDGTIKILKNTSIGNMEFDTTCYSTQTCAWNKPTTLNTYLNGTYYNGLSATVQSQIIAKDWSVGPIWEEDSLEANISDENSSKWNGKIATVTLSEYIRSNSNQSNCGILSKYQDNYRNCKNTTWMFNSSYTYWWLLAPCSGIYTSAYAVGNTGIVYRKHAHDMSEARPAVYLSSNLIISGSGTSTDPYRIES